MARIGSCPVPPGLARRINRYRWNLLPDAVKHALEKMIHRQEKHFEESLKDWDLQQAFITQVMLNHHIPLTGEAPYKTFFLHIRDEVGAPGDPDEKQRRIIWWFDKYESWGYDIYALLDLIGYWWTLKRPGPSH
jgi:hypothetical protein